MDAERRSTERAATIDPGDAVAASRAAAAAARALGLAPARTIWSPETIVVHAVLEDGEARWLGLAGPGRPPVLVPPHRAMWVAAPGPGWESRPPVSAARVLELVSELRLPGVEVEATDETLSRLARLPDLRLLRLMVRAPVTGLELIDVTNDSSCKLEPLASASVTWLTLVGASLAPDDVESIGRMPALERLDLRGATPASYPVEALRAALPRCTISLDPPWPSPGERVGPLVVDRVDELARTTSGALLHARDGRRVSLTRRGRARAVSWYQLREDLLRLRGHPLIDVPDEDGDTLEWEYDPGWTDFTEGRNDAPVGSLPQHIARRDRLEPAAAVLLIRKVAEALNHIHGLGVIVGALTPRHVQTDPPRLVNLRSALLWTRGLSPAQGRGAPRPFRRNQVMGGPHGRSIADDVWALGAILYLALTGQEAFRISGGHAEANDPPSSIRRDVPPWLDSIVLRCMAEDPAAGFADVNAFIAALDAGPPQVVARGPLDRALRWLRGE